MSEVVTITNTKDQEIEFDLTVNGLDASAAQVRFVIHTGNVDLSFSCKKQSNKWVATIPPISLLQRTAYNFTIQAIIDGYYFEPMTGTVNIVGTPQVYASGTQNKTLEPAPLSPVDPEVVPAQQSVIPAVVKVTTESKDKRTAADIAKTIIESSTKKIPLLEENSTPNEKEDRIKSILSEFKVTKIKKKGGKSPIQRKGDVITP
jgi:hypothetical protein